ncbi:MAG TPA: ABC transporter permease subunit [Bacillales bacterium]|nr:ABC transporter permease subunit [Bacillales bacterium]
MGYFQSLIQTRMFVLGMLFLLVLVAVSIGFGPLADADSSVRSLDVQQSDSMDKPPFPPSAAYPLGSNRFGQQMLWILIDGAKYTIGMAVAISLAAMVLAVGCGFAMNALPKWISMPLAESFEAFHFVPLALFVYWLVAPVLKLFNWSYGAEVEFFFPICVLIGLSVPILAVYVYRETREIARREYIVNAKVLGPSRFHIYRKHVLPLFMPKLLVIFSQQVGRVLLVFAQLGLLNVFIGGGTEKVVGHELVKNEQGIMEEVEILSMFSNSHEWAGLIGKYWPQLEAAPWLILGPVTAFALTLIAVNFVAEGMSTAAQWKPRKKRKGIAFSRKTDSVV